MKCKYWSTVTTHSIFTDSVLLYRKDIFYAYNICIRIDKNGTNLKSNLEDKYSTHCSCNNNTVQCGTMR